MKPVLILALLLICSSCSQTEPEMEASRQLYSFGSVFDIRLRGVTSHQADRILKLVEQRIDQLNQQWHPWHPSELTKINQQLQSGATFSTSPEMRALIQQATELNQLSGGLFNPAMGKLSALWGFQREDPNEQRQPPAEADIHDWLQHIPSMADIELQGSQLQGHNPYLQLDFNGFADGFALNVLQQLLQEQGVSHALINATGDVLALGSGQHGAWTVGIRNPTADSAIAKVALNNGEAIFSSGTYEKGFNYQGKRYHHILDPRTGYPSSDALAVSVISDEPIRGDAAATALVVAGPKDWYRIARQMRVKAVMLIDSNQRVHLSPEMAGRIQWLVNPTPTIELSPPLTSDKQQ